MEHCFKLITALFFTRPNKYGASCLNLVSKIIYRKNARASIHINILHYLKLVIHLLEPATLLPIFNDSFIENVQ